jgi:hypothetical protein
MIDSFENRKVVKHSGGAAGFRSYLIRIPEDDVCMVILSYSENSIDRISTNILNIVYDRPYKDPVHQKINTDSLRRYEGTYDIPGKIFLLVEAVENMLMIHLYSNRTG